MERPILLWSGKRQSRNFPANTYPFRASSHFLYFAGLNLENAVICLEPDRTILFWDEPPASYALWYGETASRSEIAQGIGVDAAYPKEELPRYKDSLTIAVSSVAPEQAQILDREPLTDRELALAIVECRLSADELALSEIRQAVQITIDAHLAGMQAAPRQ